MKKIDIVSIAFSNFKRRKTRSVLTVLGVIIGVTSIVVMVSLGIAVNVSYEQSIGQMGDLTTISVMPGYDKSTGKPTGNLDDKMVKQLSALENVTAVSPEINLNGKLVSGKFLGFGNVVGINLNCIDKLGFKVDKGTLEGLQKTSGKTIPCIIGSEVAYSFYNPRQMKDGGIMMGGMMGENGEERPPALINPMDEKTKMRFTFDYSYGEKNTNTDVNQVIKKPVLYVMKPNALLKQSMSETDSRVYIDIEQAKRLKKEQLKFEQSMSGGTQIKKNPTTVTYDQIKVITDSLDHTVAVTEQIKALGYEAWSSGQMVQESQKIAKIIQWILGGIGSIALIVAAIGITNTMIMSIYERTKEIGVMKVIGCQLKDIGTMFLCEAAFIGLFGGAIGLALSYSVSILMNTLLAGSFMSNMGMGGGSEKMMLSIIPWWLAIGSVVFAIFIGLLSGFLPARRAMKLSALEAMRN